MKNWKKITLVIAVILCLALLIEAGSYLWQSNRLVKQGYRFENEMKKPPYPTKMISFSKNYFDRTDKDRIIKNIEGKEYKTPAIIAFGDVYLNSYDNSDNTFAHKLSEGTQRPVYNMGEAGWGISQMYFLLKNEKELDNINPESLVFLYHNDMKNRLTSFSFYPHHTYLNLKYKLKDGKLVEDKPISITLYKSYAVRNIERFLGWRKATSRNARIQQKNFDLIQAFFTESKKAAQEKYPNLKKFIIVRQPASWETLEKLEEYSKSDKIAKAEYNMWKKLEEEGFIIVDLSELTDRDLSENENHSSDSSLKPEIIDLFMPALIERTELIIKTPAAKQKTVQTVKKKPAAPVKIRKTQKAVKTENKQTIQKQQEIQSVTEQKEECSLENTAEEKVISTEEATVTKKRFLDRFKRKKKDSLDN